MKQYLKVFIETYFKKIMQLLTIFCGAVMKNMQTTLYCIIALWIGLATTLYFIEINYHGSILIPTKSVDKIYTVHSTYYDCFHNYFNWNVEEITTWKVIKRQGQKVNDTLTVRVVRPTFNLWKFLALLFAPIVWSSFLFLTFRYFWYRRQELLRKLMDEYHKIDLLTRFLIVFSALAIFIASFFGRDGWAFILFVIASICIYLPIAWHFITKGIANLFYAVTKAIKDAQK